MIKLPPNRALTQLGFVVVIILSSWSFFADWYKPVDLAVLDSQFRWLRTHYPREAGDDIVVVGIDDETTKQLREPMTLWHPHLGEFFRAMRVARPSVVIVDLVLPDRSYHFLSPKYDRALLSGFRDLRPVAPVVFAQTVDSSLVLRPIVAPLVALAGPESFALVLARRDTDGILRRIDSQIRMEGGSYPTLPARAASQLGVSPSDGLIDYALGTTFKYTPLQDVLRWHANKNSRALERHFRGKAVFIGSILPYEDRHTMPVALLASEPGNRHVPGVFLQAQTLRTIMAGRVIRDASELAILALTLLASLLWWAGARLLLGTFLLLAFSLSTLTASTAALWAGTFLPIGGALISASIALTSRLGLEAWITARERFRLRRIFGGYVSPQVLRDILSGKLKPRLGGQRKLLCILFSDIRDFTSRSEHLEPEETISILNRYMTEMTTAIHSHGGTIDKFIGDGILAFFGAPQESSNPAADAFDASRDMFRRLARFNAQLESEGDTAIRVGIGLHLGHAVLGHLGSESRYEYTVIGDVVNVAARLESLTKDVGYPLVCSDTVADRLEVELIDIGPHAVKGHSPIRIFGWKPTLGSQ